MLDLSQYWVMTGSGNQILNGIYKTDDYFISYNPGKTPHEKGLMMLEYLYSTDMEFDAEETAIVVYCNNSSKKRYYILKGDFRREYEELKTLEECLAFYESKKGEFGSKWSTE